MCSCFVCLAQILVYPLNFVLAVLGIGTAGLGILIKEVADKYDSNVISNVPVQPVFIALIVLGSLMLLLSLAGCIGACCKVTCLLLLNAAGLSVFAAGKIYVLVVIIQFLAKTKNYITSKLEYLFEDSTRRVTLHALEYSLKCCGIEGSNTYESAGLLVPFTCCPVDLDQIKEDFDFNEPPAATCTDFYGGCVSAFMKYINKYSNYIKYGLGAIILIEIVTISLHLFIACFGRRKK